MADVHQGLLSNILDRSEAEIGAFGKLRENVGLVLAILIVLGLVILLTWWNWNELATRPGVGPILARLRRKPIITARPGHITIALAHLESDERHEHEGLLRDALDNKFEGAERISIDRTITLPDADPGQLAVAKAREEANLLRKEARADVLLWGKVVTRSGKSAMRLYWTTESEMAGVKPTALYQGSEETIGLPDLFWDDLKQVLGMLVQSRIATLTEALTGHYSADRLEPLIAQVRKLRQARHGAWNAEIEAGVCFAFAQALSIYGDQTGNSEALREGIDAYKQALQQTEAEVRFAFADALSKRSIDAYNQALEGYTRGRHWRGLMQNNLGVALARLSRLESETACLKEAVEALRAALQERTRDRVPLQWAVTQVNLGTVLSTLGDPEQMFYQNPLEMTQTNRDAVFVNLREPKGGVARLKEAVAAYQKALQELARNQVPLLWATTQNGLGNALAKLGGLASTRDRELLDWVRTQTNLGKEVVVDLGEQESAAALLKKAVKAYQAALQVYKPEEAPLDWAMAQTNLGNAILGEREIGTACLKEAVKACQAALQIYKRERTPRGWAQTQENLGIALAEMARHQKNADRMREALECMRGAVQVYQQSNEGYLLAIAQDRVTVMEAELLQLAAAGWNREGDAIHG